MSIQGEQVLLRVYLQSADRSPHTPTYERIVRAARARADWPAQRPSAESSASAATD